MQGKGKQLDGRRLGFYQCHRLGLPSSAVPDPDAVPPISPSLQTQNKGQHLPVPLGQGEGRINPPRTARAPAPLNHPDKAGAASPSVPRPQTYPQHPVPATKPRESDGVRAPAPGLWHGQSKPRSAGAAELLP